MPDIPFNVFGHIHICRKISLHNLNICDIPLACIVYRVLIISEVNEQEILLYFFFVFFEEQTQLRSIIVI